MAQHTKPNDADAGLPHPLDHESRALLVRCLAPILSAASDWAGLSARLAAKGYRLHFRAGRLVIVDTMSEQPVCTGADIGVPMQTLVGRLGRPVIRAGRDGTSGSLA
ncbi:hypothetical protein [Roseivivax isoporae]|uniref:Uncharacterized protein n=1 Tax=Roseivivax isoporae LMG 25204 TaxID=1449351 RepID=X7F6C2_9RHOB|nr:hypothetical protein [Roseivivax isoporae]ETX27631.1 hypothetical protein RISW2_11850 [Roseivivax isoporae LMG 25204]